MPTPYLTYNKSTIMVDTNTFLNQRGIIKK